MQWMKRKKVEGCEMLDKIRKSNKNLYTWNKIVDKIVICDNVTTLNDMAVRK